jgi:hypothetical protein
MVHGLSIRDVTLTAQLTFAGSSLKESSWPFRVHFAEDSDLDQDLIDTFAIATVKGNITCRS